MNSTVSRMCTAKFVLTISLTVILLFSASMPLNAAENGSQLHSDLEHILKQEGLTGAVWATIEPDSGTKLGAVGIKNSNTGEKLSSNDRIHVGSITKTLVATGILHLVSQGKMGLETPVSELLPEIKLENPWSATHPVLVRHLLDHSAGLDDVRLWQVFSLQSDADTPLAEAFRGGYTLLRVRTRPGTRFSYSNMGYTLLGMVIESVAGERYEQYLERELLKPLAMNDSSFKFISQKDDARIAMGHFESGEAHFTVPMYVRPAGQFTTTVNDMALFARFLMSDGTVQGETYIDHELLLAIGQPVGTEAANAGLMIGYGLGMSTRDRNGVVGKCHGGDTSGYHAMLCLYPKQQSAFFVSINTGSEIADYNAIDRRLLKQLKLASTTFASPPAAAPMSTSAWEGLYVLAPNRISTFSYLDTVFNFATLKQERAGLLFKPFQSEQVLLTSAGGAHFIAPERLLPSHVLLTSIEGKHILSNGTQSYQQTSSLKLGLLWSSLIAGLLGIAYIILTGLFRLMARRFSFLHPLAMPLLGVLALLLPLPFFYRQSFLETGDLTMASGSLAVVTTLLPLTLLFGIWRSFKALQYQARNWLSIIDTVAIAASLQWTIVLAFWELLPLRLWS